MRILITGGSGFVGRLLCHRLHEAGHRLLVVSRSPARAQTHLPEGIEIRESVMAFVDDAPEAIVNLAGEPIADKRWSEAQKQRLLESRLTITRELVTLCERLETPPRVMVSGSAMGFYGAQGERDVTEQTPPTDEFAHRLCAQWESAARAAEPLGVRVALLRTGLVLDAGGGTLTKLLPPFRLGLGGRLGSGRQYMPWIHREDLVRIVLLLLERDDLEGPFNASAPHPVTNADFTRTLAHHLHRPALMKVPAGLLRLALGEMSRLLLTGARMRPARLEAAGFTFHYPTLDSALKAILGR
ncbi:MULTISPECIES: TIGR01777 family oxidoreductase [Chromohalobacter]|uniref:TIGR01777 family oxidoreductase n=1 Tax=Chromohalobacter moromii TaxID=2860329 RepID=A0A9X2X575_9GAMM|nr:MULTISPECIES: TIGR01777 family oxidoreductase [Chromohalobacter]MCK0752994.1 TIGR01777 family oxidoreductase [Chromohalobacter japonicus]MCK2047288.1 TIGR01777 family oxidoreductase [Chromohalobacter moromii]MCT8506866.1 TIGR01777 family oxidoreductase [Chromohalobacter moromii]